MSVGGVVLSSEEIKGVCMQEVVAKDNQIWTKTLLVTALR
jgi:hypothetical protein